MTNHKGQFQRLARPALAAPSRGIVLREERLLQWYVGVRENSVVPRVKGASVVTETKTLPPVEYTTVVVTNVVTITETVMVSTDTIVSSKVQPLQYRLPADVLVSSRSSLSVEVVTKRNPKY